MAEIRDVDHGYRDLLRRVFGAAARRTRIDIGLLSESGGEPDGDSGATVLDVGIFNEFGTDTIPERSFIRAWFDEAEPKLREDLTELMKSVIAGKRTKEQILELLGQKTVGEIQERISAGIDPPNAPSTIAKKGSSTPLIDTGTLRSSISYRVEEE